MIRTEANHLAPHTGSARHCSKCLHGATFDDLETSSRTHAVNGRRHR